MLGLTLYPWQDEVLGWYEQTKRRVMGTLSTPNGAGKSSGVVAALALWWLAVHKRARVVITSKDGKQLEQQLLPAMEVHAAKFSGWSWTRKPYIQIKTPTGGVLVAFTTSDAGRAEGWHKYDDVEGPLLVIVDEAKSVEEEIFGAIHRCTFNALLYVSSPGLSMGSFYESHTKKAALFRRRKVSLSECPHIPAERIRQMRELYGPDHPLVKSSIDGDFMDQDASTPLVWPLSVVNRCIYNPPRWVPGDRSAFCDFAAGGDENVLALRHGNLVSIPATWEDRDTMRAVGKFVLEFNKASLKPYEIFADEGGLGKPMIDRLWELGWEINRVNNGGKPYEPVYQNRGSEMWHVAAGAGVKGEIILPDDPVMVAQLTTRQAIVTSEGKLGLEEKKKHKARVGQSPDRGDAVCGCWANRPLSDGNQRDSFEEAWAERNEALEANLAGMDAG